MIVFMQVRAREAPTSWESDSELLRQPGTYGLWQKGLESSSYVTWVRNLKWENIYHLILLCTGKDGCRPLQCKPVMPHGLWALTLLCCLNQVLGLRVLAILRLH